MTLKQDIDKDTVKVRWIRTAFTTIASVAAGCAALYTAAIFVFEPRADKWVRNLIAEDRSVLDLQLETFAAQLVDAQVQQNQMMEIIANLQQTVGEMQAGRALEVSPSWRFSTPDTSISDGVIGGKVTIRASGYKLRECGVPTIDLYFVNGNGVYHRFQDTSLLDNLNRGVAFPVDPSRLQQVVYSATIPEGDDVKPGRANGWISVSYPRQCPLVDPAVVGPLQFRIYETFDELDED